MWKRSRVNADRCSSMANYPPNIEQLTPAGSYRPPGSDIPWHNTLRVRIFALTFVAITAIGLTYTFSQRPVYRSQATLLTSMAYWVMVMELPSSARDGRCKGRYSTSGSPEITTPAAWVLT